MSSPVLLCVCLLWIHVHLHAYMSTHKCECVIAEGDIQADHHSTLHAEEEEDIVFVMKRQLAEANNLLAKCGEALRLDRCNNYNLT